MDKLLEVVIQEHRVRERREGDGGELDFVDILLDFQRENASLTPIEDDTTKLLFWYEYFSFTICMLLFSNINTHVFSYRNTRVF